MASLSRLHWMLRLATLVLLVFFSFSMPAAAEVATAPIAGPRAPRIKAATGDSQSINKRCMFHFPLAVS